MYGCQEQTICTVFAIIACSLTDADALDLAISAKRLAHHARSIVRRRVLSLWVLKHWKYASMTTEQRLCRTVERMVGRDVKTYRAMTRLMYDEEEYNNGAVQFVTPPRPLGVPNSGRMEILSKFDRFLTFYAHKARLHSSVYGMLAYGFEKYRYHTDNSLKGTADEFITFVVSLSKCAAVDKADRVDVERIMHSNVPYDREVTFDVVRTALYELRTRTLVALYFVVYMQHVLGKGTLRRGVLITRHHVFDTWSEEPYVTHKTFPYMS